MVMLRANGSKLGRGIAALALVSALSGCANFRNSVSNLWPFGGDEDPGATFDHSDGRISIMPSEGRLSANTDVAAVEFAPPAAHAAVDWPFVGGNSANAPEHLIADGHAGLRVVSRFHAAAGSGDRRFLVAPPVFAGGRVYTFGTDHIVRAIDLANGHAVWTRSLARTRAHLGWFREESLPTAGGIGFDDGRVFAASGYGQLSALNANDGSIAWQYETQTPLHSSPVVSNGRVFVTSYDSEFYALDAHTGAQVWSSAAISESARMLTSPSAAVVGETVIVPYPSGELVAMLTNNGRRLWQDGLTRAGAGNSMSTINDIASRPAVSGGVVYADSQSGTLAAVDVRTGTRLWDLPISSIQMPWVAGNFLFIVSTDCQLVAIERASGKIKWVQQLARFENPRKRKGRIVWTGPALVDGQLVLASSSGQVITVDPANGTTTQTININTPVFLPPAVANGRVYFLGNNGDLIGLQ